MNPKNVLGRARILCTRPSKRPKRCLCSQAETTTATFPPPSPRPLRLLLFSLQRMQARMHFPMGHHDSIVALGPKREAARLALARRFTFRSTTPKVLHPVPLMVVAFFSSHFSLHATASPHEPILTRAKEDRYANVCGFCQIASSAHLT
jgi:hypothetical protein